MYSIDIEAVESMLEAFKPFDECESKHRSACLDLLRQNEAAFSRSNFEPGHFTASALVTRDDQHVLMILHEKLNRWLQPGGHLERDDQSMLEAAVREVSEETGISLRVETGSLIDVDVHEIPETRAAPRHLHHDLRFLFSIGADRPNAVAATDAKKVKWMHTEQLVKMHFDASILRMTNKIGKK